MYTNLLEVCNMAISNETKRRLTCQFCPKKGKKNDCRCKKYWKIIYKEHRDEILNLHQNELLKFQHKAKPP